ncbi:MAG: hypothetical protein JW809_06250 [Pirellulales bacterium]|nr:hypothetical protein [Pirellulales bacterium]
MLPRRPPPNRLAVPQSPGGAWARARSRLRACCAALGIALAGASLAQAVDVSAPPILQWFDASRATMVRRAPDLFLAGYGHVWVPPQSRAGGDGLGGFSVGYDVYDRFDLGSPGHPTRYGTETGLKTVVQSFHRAGVDVEVDYIINHNGTQDMSSYDGEGHTFLDAGGYPGFLLTHPEAIDGDFHSRYASGDQDGRLGGLIDIDHGTDFRYVRNPVPGVEPVPGDHGGNLPAGTVSAFGRLANVPSEENRRFYPDRDLAPIWLFDPVTGEQNIAVYPFNRDAPAAGDPVGENALGYLMRNMQWMVQEIGVDGFRLDAARHVEGWVLDYVDRAVYRASTRTLLDGSTKHVFSYCESASSDRGYVQTFIQKTIDPADAGRIGGNRDALDFPLFFALRDNLTSNGLANDWRNVVGAGMDVFDDGMHNGSQGVTFTQSHDDFGPALSNVAYAYTLLLPGNAVVYFNAKEFGPTDFPKPGRGDALGGVYGDAIRRLVALRNSHGRGDYRERWLEKELYAYERSGAALVLLSNRLDAGHDQRRVDVDFAWGTTLVELTGNAAAHGDIPELVTVDNDYFEGPSKATVRFLRNDGADQGYLVYGLAVPRSAAGVELTHVTQVLAGAVPAANDFDNGVTRLADLNVITADSFQVSLATQPVVLSGTRLEGDSLVSRAIRDHDADGDNALVRIDEGLDLNGNGFVDHVAPGSAAYGFEEFTELRSPGYWANGGAGGAGLYRQTIDATALAEGTHYVTVRAFRHRADGGPAVYEDFKSAVYVDRLPPVAGIRELVPVNAADSGDRDVFVASLDQTAERIHVFADLAAATTDAEILALAGQGAGVTEQVDLDLFKAYFAGLGTGNHVFTLVAFEPTGNANVQRLAGQWIDGRGAGLGDLNHDGLLAPGDLEGTPFGFEHVLYAQNAEFNAAADVNADGRIDNRDLFALDNVLDAAGAAPATRAAYEAVLLRRGNVNGQYGTDAWDIDALYSRFGSTDWFDDMNVDGVTDAQDVAVLVHQILGTQFGDANLDRRVDEGDAAILAAHWLQDAVGWAGGDFNGDGRADDLDLAILAAHWQWSPASASVPEPSAGVLLAAGAAILFGVRRLVAAFYRRHS